MKKSLFFFAAAALALTACSNDEDVNTSSVKNNAQAVAFDTYTSGTTRAGMKGVMTTATLQKALGEGGGFGVFAYQTSDTYPAGGTGKKPNFMYNEPVSYVSSVWSYSVLKYWPNNTTQDELGASGHATTTTPNDYVSFFAYAPYVSAGAPAEAGITGMSANTATGDPTISYQVATDPAQSVDLLWAVTPTAWTYTDVAADIWNETGSEDGLPLIDLLKPDVQTRVKFLFLHALARLGVNVVAAVDQEAAGGELDSQTKIVITSVTITDATGTPNLAPSGTLNLNNTTANTALWTPDAISSPFTASISTTGIESSLLYETDAATSWAKEGVLTAKEKPLIAGGNYYMLIPPTTGSTDLNVNIVYHVITKDTKLDGGYSDVVNNITRKVSIDFDNGKAYTLKLILGLTSVKLDAEVKTWEVQGATNVDLPKNQE